MATRITIRRSTAAEWAQGNPVLALGELALTSDVSGGELKIGDGATHWADLVVVASPAVMLGAASAAQAAAEAQEASTLAASAARTAADAARKAQDAIDFLIDSGALPGNGGGGGGGGTGNGTVISINGQEPDEDGAITLSAADVGAFPTDASFDWAKLLGVPTTFAPSAHSHPVSGVTGLQADLDGRVMRRGSGAVGLWPAAFALPTTGMQAGDYIGIRKS